MRPDSSEEIFAVIIFADRMHDVLIPLPVDAHVPYVNQKKNNTEPQSNEASSCNNGLVFFCVEAFAITKALELPLRVRNC